ncbi:phage tail protein [Maribellus luteus]|uniref:Phage tail protein n=1 Tax=Maribellus luteus TaxID=2305463 RepID=A0A399SVM2_9BACT|nr:tail fiber protein [Maribellus luteus]RIJ46692.1 phage tail protein [Maribellus luteus]
MDPLLGTIQAFGFNFAPRGWNFCGGQLISISQNTALFSLLGTMFGGDGRTTFALPDLRGRVMVGYGDGPGLTSMRMGDKGGSENTTLTALNLPSHTHTANLTGSSVTIKASSAAGTSPAPSSRSNVLSAATSGNIYTNNTPDVNLNVGNDVSSGNITIGNTGGSIPFNNMQPYQVVNLCIAMVGIFPSRN